MKKGLIILGILFGVSLTSLCIWYVYWVNFVDNYELGFVYDKYTGTIEEIPHKGWLIMTPWHYDVHTIDLRPKQVCINGIQRVMNCKLVRFDPKGMKTFVEWHGRAAGGNIYEILKGYAFNVIGGKDCPFLIVIDEMERKNIDQPAVTK